MDIESQIRALAADYAARLTSRIAQRQQEMSADDTSHYLIYRVLGVSFEEGQAIDLYQNKGRFLYRYAGSFLEEATKMCLEESFPDVQALRIPNTLSNRPKTFEIDCLLENDAYEIKWRDATTDGDHIVKEHMRLRCVVDAGYRPVRLMYYSPNREQAIWIQAALEDLYKANDGLYFSGEQAWAHLHEKTGVDLLAILNKIADESDS